MPKREILPSRRDIDVFDSLGGRRAVDNSLLEDINRFGSDLAIYGDLEGRYLDLLIELER